MILIVHAVDDERTIRRRLGQPEYSYYFVLEEFLPVLEGLGTVVRVRDPETEVDRIHRRAGDRETCVFLSFSPPHRTPVDLECPTLPVFAWEFDDLPDETWDGEPRNDWRYTLERTGGAIVHSTHAARVVAEAMGSDWPVLPIPAPVWDRFAVSGDRPGGSPLRRMELTFVGSAMDSLDLDAQGDPSAAPAGYEARAVFDVDLETPPPPVRARETTLGLGGVVYTTIFNPRDGRKNWRDLLRGFCVALRDRADATLVLKIVGSGVTAIRVHVAGELGRLGPMRCRVVLLDAFLDDATYRSLAEGSTYAVNASHGEGQCLPLMEYMSLGKPAVAPAHSGMKDYVDETNAFVVSSSREPASWPHDPRDKVRTFRQRIDMESLIEAFRRSYDVATGDPTEYRRMSTAATARLRRHASSEVVGPKLGIFLDSWL